MEYWRLGEPRLLVRLCNLKNQRSCGYVPDRYVGKSAPCVRVIVRVTEVLSRLSESQHEADKKKERKIMRKRE
jgi:hypothetical protein